MVPGQYMRASHSGQSKNRACPGRILGPRCRSHLDQLTVQPADRILERGLLDDQADPEARGREAQHTRPGLREAAERALQVVDVRVDPGADRRHGPEALAPDERRAEPLG